RGRRALRPEGRPHRPVLAEAQGQARTGQGVGDTGPQAGSRGLSHAGAWESLRRGPVLETLRGQRQPVSLGLTGVARASPEEDPWKKRGLRTPRRGGIGTGPTARRLEGTPAAD